MPRMPVYFFGKSYWRPLERFFRNKMATEGMIGKRDLNIFRLTDDPKEIVAAANHVGHPKVTENYYDDYSH